MSILPHKFKSKIGSKEPENRQNLSYARGLIAQVVGEGGLAANDFFIDIPIMAHLNGEVGIGVVVVVLRELELSLLALFFGPTVVHRSASLDCGEVSCSGSEPNSSASVGWTVLSSAGEE